MDDGSNDGSREKCLNYATQFDNVYAFIQNRKGVSAARNNGIHHASGDYLMFMDNDDFYGSNDVFSNIARCISETHADVIMFNRINFWGQGGHPGADISVNRTQINASEKAASLNYCIEKDLLTRAVWTKAINRKLIMEHSIFFPEGKRNEDTYFTGKLIQFAKSFDWCDSIFYMYRKGTGNSQSDQKISYQIVKDLKDVCIDYVNSIKASSDPDNLKEIYYSYIAYPYAVLMMFIGQLNEKRLKQDIKDIKKYAFVLNYDINPYVKTIKKFYKLFGFTLTIKALYIYEFFRSAKRQKKQQSGKI